MGVQLSVRKSRMPLRLLYASRRRLSDDDYWAFCEANSDLRIERSAEGEIILVPPAGGESSSRNLKVAIQFGFWAEKDRRGEAFDSSVQFMLPDGSALSPDAAWVSHEARRRLSKEDKQKFLRLSPEFIVEVRSRSDRLPKALAKMDQWMSNGVQLAWFIDGDARTVYVYRPGQPVEKLQGIHKLPGEGPVKGFVLKLGSIWKGLA